MDYLANENNLSIFEVKILEKFSMDLGGESQPILVAKKHS